jgi:hypothetical protein
MRRAEGCQRSSDYERVDMTAAILTERKSVAKGETLRLLKLQSPLIIPASKNN